MEFNKVYSIDNENGSAYIQVKNDAAHQAKTILGYNDNEEVDLDDKQLFNDYVKKFNVIKIYLISWHSKNDGFGRSVIRKIFDLAKEYGVNEFTCSLQSAEARDVFQHYLNKGVLKGKANSLSGLSTDQYYKSFILVNRP